MVMRSNLESRDFFLEFLGTFELEDFENKGLSELSLLECLVLIMSINGHLVIKLKLTYHSYILADFRKIS